MSNSVGIIGGAGAEGSHVGEILKRSGLDVTISDINQEKAAKVAEAKGFKIASSEQLAEANDLVLFSVPIDVIPDVIRQYGPLVRRDSAMADLASIKTKAMEAMFQIANDSGTEVFSTHLMYGPTVSPWKQNVLMIPGRPLGTDTWYKRFEEIMKKNKANVSRIESAEKHDQLMAVLQVLPHAMAYAFLSTLENFTPSRTVETLPVGEIEKYSTLLLRLKMDADGRVVANPNAGRMYGGIQIENPRTPEIYDMIIGCLERQKHLAETRDLKGFEQIHRDLNSFLGAYAQAAQERTDSERGRPTGIQLVYKAIDRPAVERALRTFRNAPKKYLEQLETTVIDTGDLNKLNVDLIDKEKKIVLGRPVIAERVLHVPKNASAGNYAFFVKNRKDPETGQTLFFTPTTPEDLEDIVRKHPERKRIQMFNRYQDPFLNLFDTWERTKDLPKPVILVAYSTN